MSREKSNKPYVKPYVISHVVATLDGKISGDAFYTKAMEPVLEDSWKIRDSLKCQGILAGTTTAAEIYADGIIAGEDQIAEGGCGGDRSIARGGNNREGDSDGREKGDGREDYVADTDLKDYAIAVDAEGILNWTKNYVDRPVQPRSHVIVAITEQTPSSYIKKLRDLNISFVSAGTYDLDIPLMLQKLKELFEINRLMCCGGGTMNWSMLEAGCLDELSVAMAPVSDGRNDTSSIFGRSSFSSKDMPKAFTLKDVQRISGDGLWLRYEFKPAE